MDEDGTYLVELYTIRLAPSLKILDATRSNKRRRQEDASPRVFIVGNPFPVSKDLEMEELDRIGVIGALVIILPSETV